MADGAEAQRVRFDGKAKDLAAVLKPFVTKINFSNMAKKPKANANLIC